MASPVKQIGRELGVRYVDRTALVGEARIACYVSSRMSIDVAAETCGSGAPR